MSSVTNLPEFLLTFFTFADLAEVELDVDDLLQLLDSRSRFLLDPWIEVLLADDFDAGVSMQYDDSESDRFRRSNFIWANSFAWFFSNSASDGKTVFWKLPKRFNFNKKIGEATLHICVLMSLAAWFIFGLYNKEMKLFKLVIKIDFNALATLGNLYALNENVA